MLWILHEQYASSEDTQVLSLTDRDFIGCQYENQREFTDISRADLHIREWTKWQSTTFKRGGYTREIIYLQSSSLETRLRVRLADEKFLVCGSGSVCLAALKLVLTYLSEWVKQRWMRLIGTRLHWEAPLGERYRASDGAEFNKKPKRNQCDLVEMGIVVIWWHQWSNNLYLSKWLTFPRARHESERLSNEYTPKIKHSVIYSPLISFKIHTAFVEDKCHFCQHPA